MPAMKVFFAKLLNRLWLSFAAIIITLAVLVSLARAFLPFVEVLKPELETFLAEKLDAKVSIQSLKGSWEKTGPKLVFDNVLIEPKTGSHSPIKVEKLAVEVNFWMSLFKLQFNTSEFSIHNSQISLDLDVFNQSKSSSRAPSPSNATYTIYSAADFLFDTLLGQNHVDISEINVIFYSGEKVYPTFTLNHLSIDNFSETHQLSGELIQQNGGSFSMVLEIEGDPRTPTSQTKAYLKSDQLNTLQLPFIDRLLSGQLKQGTIDGELWLQWSLQGESHAYLDLSMEPVSFEIRGRAFEYQELSASLSWKKSSNGNHLIALDKLNAQSNEHGELQLGGLQVNWTQGVALKKHKNSATVSIESVPDHRLHLSYRDVEPGKLNAIWALVIDEPVLQQWFLNANPQLKLKDFELTIDKYQSGWQVTQGILRIDDLQFTKTDMSPSLPKTQGVVELSQNGVAFDFKTQAGEIDYRPLFRWPMMVNELQLNGRFFSLEHESYVTFDRFSIELDDVSLLAKGSVYLRENTAPELSVQAEVYNGKLESKSKYLPVAVMGAGLTEYLDESVRGGTISLARMNMQARLVADFMSQPDTTFEILGFGENLQYNYLPDWPALSKLNATLFFDQNGMFIEATEGSLWDLEVKKAEASIADFSATIPELILDIEAELDHKSGVQLVSQSGLKDLLGELIEKIQPDKRFKAKTFIKLPLEGDDDLTMQGRVSLDGNAVYFSPLDLNAKSVVGAIQFSEDKVWSDPISVNVLGGKSKVTLDTKLDDGAKNLTLMGGGSIGTHELSQWLLPENTLKLDSKVDYQVAGKFCITQCTAEQVRVTITSDLKDTSLPFPEPFVKQAGESWPVQVDIVNVAEEQRVEFNVNDRVKGQIVFDQESSKEKASYGAITVGDSEHVIEWTTDQMAVHINLNSLDFLQWMDIVNQAISRNKSIETHSTAPLKVVFNISQLQFAEYNLTGLSGNLAKDNSGYYVIDMTSDQAQGAITLRENNQLDIRLDYLTIDDTEKLSSDVSSDESGENKAERKDTIESGFSVTNFEQWPAIQFQCAKCQFFGKDLGEIKAIIDPQSELLKVKGRITREKGSIIDFLVSWSILGNKQSTTIESRFSIAQFGEMLKSWQQDIGLKNSRVEGALITRWNGSPFEFNKEKINGGVTVSVSSGYLEDVSDAKARLFSIFSLQNLFRRLTLDFSDIFKQGFFYQSMTGDFKITEGKVTTNNFFIDGNAADVRLSGFVDLKQETLDQYASVTPKVTSSLPVLAGWAVEPTTGIMVWLLSKIFQPAIDVITNIEYQMIGPWQSPQVIELKKSTREVELTDEELDEIRKTHEEQERAKEDKLKLQKSDRAQSNLSDQLSYQWVG